MKCWLLNDMDTDVMVKKYGKELDVFSDAVKNMPEWCEMVNVYDLAIEVNAGGKGKILKAGELVERPDVAICLFAGQIVGADKKDYDNVHHRIIDQLEMLGTFCLQSRKDIETTSNKLKCNQLLAAAGIKVADTILITDAVKPAYIVQRLGLPVVVKPNDGSEGNGVCLVETEKELEHIMELRDRSVSLIAQKYISTSRGRDMRMVLIGDELVYSMVRDNTGSDDFRSNIARGGKVLELTPPQEAIDIALKTKKVLGLKLCGVDLLFGENCTFYVGEVNSVPGYGNGQKYNGELVSQRYMSMVQKFIIENCKGGQSN